MIRIAYIDDEVELVELFKYYFDPDRHQVETFEKQTDALAYLESNQVDVFFIDYNMPEGSGAEFARKIADHDCRTVLITGHITDDLKKDQRLFDRILFKPLSGVDLAKVAEELGAMKAAS